MHSIICVLVSIFVVATSRKLGKHINITALSTSAGIPTKTQLSRWSNTGNMSVLRSGFESCLLTNEKVLVIGGIVDDGTQRHNRSNDAVTLDSTEFYDPLSENWTMSGTMHFSQTEFAASLLHNETALATGGVADGQPVMQTAELCDPSSGNWTTLYTMPDCQSGHTSTLLPNGKVLLVGGYCSPFYKNTADLYDPITEKRTTTGTLHYPRAYHTASLLANGKVLVTGGIMSDGPLTNITELYDPSTGNWTTGGHMHFARTDHTEIVLNDGNVLVTGGFNEHGTLAQSELYNSSTQTWMRTE